MIRTYFGLSRTPSSLNRATRSSNTSSATSTSSRSTPSKAASASSLGEPGTGKTVLKNAILQHDPKHWITPVINRSLHTWHNMLRLLCHAFQLETHGSDHKCEERLIHEAKHLNAKGKLIVPIIDDAHLLPIDALRKLRLLLEDFPKNHNLILFGQPAVNTTLQLSINHDIRSRITYSAKIDALAPHTITDFIHSQLDRVGLPHHTFTEAAANLIIRSSEGTLRAVKNLCIGALIEAVRDLTKTVDLKQVNAVLLQPHWRHYQQNEPVSQGIVFTNRPPASQSL